jgi:hypothetical protein
MTYIFIYTRLLCFSRVIINIGETSSTTESIHDVSNIYSTNIFISKNIQTYIYVK